MRGDCLRSERLVAAVGGAWRMRWLGLGLVAAAAACTPDERVPGGGGSGGQPSTSANGDDGNADDDADDGVEGGEGTGDAGTRLDTPDDGGNNLTGCGEVDLLFVIDNSASMGTYQTQLGAQFPAFIDALWTSLPTNTSVHVGLTTTDFGSPGCNNAVEATLNCQSTATSTEIISHYDTPDGADSGVNGAQGRLFRWNNRTFFEANTEDDPGPLTTWFSQAATAAGETGCTFEMPVAAAGWAFAEPNLSGANAGFLRREGALLVIFFLTDEPDKSPESIAVHRDRILDAKAGCGGGESDDICVVTAGFIPPCTVLDTPQQKLWRFMLEFGEDESEVRWGDIGATNDYAQLVGSVLASTIAEACEAVPPVG